MATVRFPLRMPALASEADVEAAIAALVRRVTTWDIPHTPPGTSALVAPGSPERSALIVRMHSRRPSSQMPPLGTVLPDREALAMLSSWVGAMGAEPHPQEAVANGDTAK